MGIFKPVMPIEPKLKIKSMLKKFINKILGKSTDTMSFMESMNLVDLPVVTFFQENNRFNFLLDTGSTSCVINKSVLSKLDYKVKSRGSSTLMGMDGIKHDVDTCEISLFYKEKEYTFDYLIQDMSAPFDNIKQTSGVVVHGILGSKFFNKFKYVLDFKELIAYSKQ